MQLSNNVIKNSSVKNTGFKEIITIGEIAENKAVNEVEAETAVDNYIENYESLAKSIVDNARKESEQILSKAYEEASRIQEVALIKAEELKSEAYERGYAEGYNIAYEKAYHEASQQAKIEGEAIIASAEELLSNAKAEYEEYLQRKTVEISDLVMTITKAVLKKEAEDKSALNAMLYEALEMSKKAKNFIVRCSPIYVEELKEQSDNWKKQLGFLGDIFIMGDNSLEPGNVVIDKGNGRVVAGIDYALQRIEQILEEKE